MISLRATVFSLLAFLAMLTLVSTAQAGNEDYVHSFTGFTFPLKFEGFDRVKVTPFNEEKSDIEVDYNNSPFTTHLSFYVYPAGDPLKKHYEECREAVTKPHPDAKLIEEKPITLTKNGKVYEGYSAVFGFKDSFVGKKDQDLLSQVILFQFEHYYVLYRISYAASDKENAEKQITNFIEKFVWPSEEQKNQAPPML